MVGSALGCVVWQCTSGLCVVVGGCVWGWVPLECPDATGKSTEVSSGAEKALPQLCSIGCRLRVECVEGAHTVLMECVWRVHKACIVHIVPHRRLESTPTAHRGCF